MNIQKFCKWQDAIPQAETPFLCLFRQKEVELFGGNKISAFCPFISPDAAWDKCPEFQVTKKSEENAEIEKEH